MIAAPQFAASSAKHIAAHGTGAGVALVVLLLFYRGVYAPLQEDVAERNDRITRVSLLTARGEQFARIHRETSDRLEELRARAAAARAKMPHEISASTFVEEATRLATQFDLAVQQCTTEMPQRRDDHATIDVSYRLAGTYASICGYLAAVDQIPQMSRVTRMELARSPESDDYPLTVTFQLYYQLDPHDKDPQSGNL